MSDNNVEELTQQADSLLDKGDIGAAYSIFDQICRIDEGNADAWFMKGSINGETGRVDQAIKDIRQAIEIDPDYAEAHYNLASLYRAKGLLEQSIPHLEAAISLDSSFFEACIMLSAIAGQLDLTETCITYSRKAVELQPDSVDANINLANAFQQNGQIAESLPYYQKIVNLGNPPPVTHFMFARACAATGDTETAEKHYRLFVEQQPESVDGWYALGETLHTQEQHQEALDCYRKALSLHPGHPLAAYKSAIIHQANGNADEATTHYRTALLSDPDNATAHFNLALILQEANELDEAKQHLEQAIRAQPDHVKAYGNLAYIQRIQGLLEAAAGNYRKALEIEPESDTLLFNLGCTLKDKLEAEAALDCFDKAVRINPEHAEAMFGAGDVQQVLGNYDSAIAYYRRGIPYAEKKSEAYVGLSSCYISLGRQDQAVAVCNEALSLYPDNPNLMIAVAAALMTLKEEQQALQYALKAATIDPDNIEAKALLSNIHDRLGNTDSAYEVIKDLIDTSTPITSLNLALAYSGVAKSIGRQNEVVQLMEELLAGSVGAPVQNRRSLHYALGKHYDSLKQFDKAFNHYTQGSKLVMAAFDQQKHERGIEDNLSLFSHDFMNSAPRSNHTTDKPVFIVGMPRSGTSLTEQILASHPAVYGAGELPNMINAATEMRTFLSSDESYPFCLKGITIEQLDTLAESYLTYINSLSPDATRVIDKMPGNFMNLGLIEMLFPNARIIHCMRNPIDTCLSGYFQDFSRSHPYSYNLENLAFFYNNYRKVMQHWRQVLKLPILEIQYEDLVDRQEERSRELVEFCGLQWEEQCLDFHETQRFVGTASHDQVRQPMYKRSVARWRNYEQYIQPLIEGLQPSL